MRATDDIGKQYLAVARHRNGGMQFMRAAGKQRAIAPRPARGRPAC